MGSYISVIIWQSRAPGQSRAVISRTGTEPILDGVLKLHKEVSDDIEFRLRSSDQNFIKCYSEYLNTYHKIVSKARGQAPLNSLSAAYMYHLVEILVAN